MQIFCKPPFDLEPDKSSESQQNNISNNILSIRKYCQFFTHDLNTFLGKQYVILPIQTNWDANAEKSQKEPLLLQARGLPSNTSMPGPSPLTTPNGVEIKSAVLPQYTLQTDRPTDRPTHRQTVQANVPYHERSTRYADRQQHANNMVSLNRRQMIANILCTCA